MSLTDQAICVRAIDYSETSQVVHLLTRAGGLVRLLAKGSKRAKSKSGGALDLFAQGQCVYAPKSGEALGTLMEFAETTAHIPLRRGLDRLNAGLYLLELCGALLPAGDPHPEVFDLLASALARLEASEALVPGVVAYFQWRLARAAGLLGDLTTCVNCGRAVGGEPRGWSFSSAAGGLVCRACQGSGPGSLVRARGGPHGHANGSMTMPPGPPDRFVVSADALAGLAALEAAGAGHKAKLTAPQAVAAARLLNYHLEYQLGRHFRTAIGALR